MIYMATVTASVCSASFFMSISQPTFPDNWLVLLDALYMLSYLILQLEIDFLKTIIIPFYKKKLKLKEIKEFASH